MTAKELVELLGPDLAWEFSKAWGGCFESIPTMSAISTATKHMAIAVASARGVATCDIASKLSLDESAVIRIIKAQSN